MHETDKSVPREQTEEEAVAEAMHHRSPVRLTSATAPGDTRFWVLRYAIDPTRLLFFRDAKYGSRLIVFTDLDTAMRFREDYGRVTKLNEPLRCVRTVAQSACIEQLADLCKTTRYAGYWVVTPETVNDPCPIDNIVLWASFETKGGAK